MSLFLFEIGEIGIESRLSYGISIGGVELFGSLNSRTAALRGRPVLDEWCLGCSSWLGGTARQGDAGKHGDVLNRAPFSFLQKSEGRKALDFW